MARGRRDQLWEPLAWHLARSLNAQGAKITDYRRLLPFRLSSMGPEVEPVVRDLNEMSAEEIDAFFGGDFQ